MISYQWYLSPDQPFNKKELFKLQYCLYAAGIYLDLSWKDGSPVMTISVPEQAPEDKSGLITEESISSSDSGPCNDALESLDPKAPAHKRGRPSVVPKYDITLGCVQHKRFMGISVEAIAKEIGVSKRTFYRRWTQVESKRQILGRIVSFLDLPYNCRKIDVGSFYYNQEDRKCRLLANNVFLCRSRSGLSPNAAGAA